MGGVGSGSKPKPAHLRRSQRVQTQLTASEARALRTVAEARGVSVSTMVREMILGWRGVVGRTAATTIDFVDSEWKARGKC